MFYGKLTRTTMPQILSVSLLTTKEHPYKIKKKRSARQFFTINEKVKNRLFHKIFHKILYYVIYQTRGRVFHQISKQPSFFNQLRSVWISDETLSRVFDIASQSIDNSWRKSKQNFSEFYDN